MIMSEMFTAGPLSVWHCAGSGDRWTNAMPANHMEGPVVPSWALESYGLGSNLSSVTYYETR